MNLNEINKNALEIYNKSIDKFGADTFGAVHWGDEQKALYRYQLIHKHILNDSEVSVLDVGCGNGGLFKFLNFSGFRGKYTGYDINEDLIKSAKQTYSGVADSFYVIDILNDKINETFDYVVVSGLFNSNYGQNLEWVHAFVKKLYKFSNKKVIFNAISTYTNFKEASMYYINPLEITDFIIKHISKEVILEHGQLPYNFQIVISKDRPWESIS